MMQHPGLIVYREDARQYREDARQYGEPLIVHDDNPFVRYDIIDTDSSVD